MIRHAVIRDLALARPDAPAIIDGARLLTRAQLERQVAAVATGLCELTGSSSQTLDRPCAAFMSENCAEVVVLQAAAATIGLPLVGLGDGLSVAQLVECLTELRPVLIAISRRAHAHIVAALEHTHPSGIGRLNGFGRPKLLLLPDGEPCADGDWHALTEHAPDPASWPAPPFLGLAFTSGTSGRPKLVSRSRRFESRRHADVSSLLEIPDRDVYLNTVPLHHASGPSWARVFATHGAPLVLAPHDDPDAIVQAIAYHGVTATLMVPSVLDRVLRHLEAEALEIGAESDVRLIVTGGRHVSPSLVRRCRQAFGRVLRVYYGTTETGLNTITTPGELTRDPGTAGRPLPGNTIVILDDDGAPQPEGAAGRVAVAGYMVADGYAGHPGGLVDAGGERAWLTPDHGWLDAAGQLHILGRGLPEGAGTLDVAGLEGHLRDALDLDDVAILIDLVDTALTLTIAFCASASVACSEVIAQARPWAAGWAIDSRQVPAIPYSSTGKVREDALIALVSRTAADELSRSASSAASPARAAIHPTRRPDGVLTSVDRRHSC